MVKSRATPSETLVPEAGSEGECSFLGEKCLIGVKGLLPQTWLHSPALSHVRAFENVCFEPRDSGAGLMCHHSARGALPNTYISLSLTWEGHIDIQILLLTEGSLHALSLF